MLPWLTQQLEDAEETLGAAANRDNLATFLRYHHEQGLSPRLLGPEELFVTETAESALV